MFCVFCTLTHNCSTCPSCGESMGNVNFRSLESEVEVHQIINQQDIDDCYEVV